MRNEIIISRQLQKPEFRFAKLVKGGKRAVETGWQTTQNYQWNDEELQKWIKQGNNYGIVCGKGDLIVLDFDHLDKDKELRDRVFEILPETFVVRSGSGEGFHFYYYCRGAENNVYERSDGIRLEVRAKRLAAVGPSCIHPSGGRYEIFKDNEIKKIRWDTLLDKLMLLGFPLKSKIETLKQTNEGVVRANILSVLTLWNENYVNTLKRSGNELYGSHPIHGSTTGKNFWVNPSENVWFCFRHQMGGGVLELIAILEGITTCEDLKDGLKGEAFKKTLEVARKKYRLHFTEKLKEKFSVREVSAEEFRDIETRKIKIRINLPPENLIQRFVDVISQRSDVYTDYLYLTALANLSLITDKKIYLPMTQGNVYPNLWIFLLGESTISRKSFAVVDSGEKFINSIGGSGLFYPHDFSPEALIEFMSKQSHGAIYFDEGAGFLRSMIKQQYKTGMLYFLCRLYDGSPIFRKLRSGKDKIFEFRVDDPFLVFLLASQPQTLQEYASEELFMSGFFYRFLFAFPNYPKERWLPPLPEDEKLRRQMEELINLWAEKYRWIQSIDTPISYGWEPDTYTIFIKWLQTMENKIKSEYLLKYFGRLQFIVLKLAMLFDLGDSEPRLKIRKDYLLESIRLAEEYFIPTFDDVYRFLRYDVGRNLQEKILSILHLNNGRLTFRGLCRRLHVRSDKLESALEFLSEYSGEVEIVDVKTGGRPSRYVILSQHEGGDTDFCHFCHNVTLSQTSQKYTSRGITPLKVEICDNIDKSDNIPNSNINATLTPQIPQFSTSGQNMTNVTKLPPQNSPKIGQNKEDLVLSLIPFGKNVSYAEVEKANLEKNIVPHHEFHDIINKLLKEGLLFEPRPGYLRKTNP